jgi:hypothetical protein
MGLDGPLRSSEYLRERGVLDVPDDGAGAVVDDRVPGQAQLDYVNAVAAIEARLNVARLHVDRISPLSATLRAVHHLLKNAMQSIARTPFFY